MRILFVFRSTEWLGLEFLSAVLKKAGHITDLAFEVDIGGTFYFQSFIKHHNSIIKKIREFKPDIILVSSTTNLFPWVKSVTKEIKQNFDIPILVGGIHPTILPEKTLNYKYIDMICIGEGEEAIVELVDKIEKKQDYYDTKNFWFKTKKGIIKNNVRPLITDLDTLPLPDKDMFYKYGCFVKRAYVMASRGCPYRCTYCFNHQLQKIYGNEHYVRMRSVDKVIEELRFYKKKYGITSVHFYDDTFILNKEWVFEFSRKYKKKINLPFSCFVRANLVTKEIISSLKKAGVRYISMGLESGNDRVRSQILKRNMSDKQIIDAAGIIKSYGIKLITFNMFGLPSETPNEMLDTINLNLKIRPESIFSFVFYPYPGTDLMNLSSELGYLNKNILKKIENGESNYISEPLMNHPYKTEAYNMKIILPLLNKLPRQFHGFFLKKWVYRKHSPFFLNVIKILSIPLYSSWESWERFKEQMLMGCVCIGICKRKL